MNVLSTKFKALALFSSIALLTACNQPTKTEKSTNPVTASSASSVVASTKTNETARAGHDMSKMNGMGTASSPTASQPAHVAEYMQSMNTMHEQMMSASHIANPDVAFATGMIAHHQGAIDMANTELKMGKDKEMLQLAKQIKSAQDPEIKQMQAWLDSKKTK